MKKREEEINKCILEYLINKNYTNSVEPFIKDTGLNRTDATKGNKLEKKWGTLLSLQKKISDLENEVKQLKEDLERGGAGLSDKAKKEAESMGLPKSIPKATVKGHRQGVTCLCFHPFYKRLASGSDDASIIIWECDEFTEERSLKAHSDTINHLTFDNNGKYLASCSSDLTIKIWNFDTMTVFRTLNGHEHTVSCVEFTPDGNFLYSASRDHMIKYWDINSGNCKNTLKGHEEWVRSVSLNTKGSLLASSSDDEKIFVWQTGTNTVQHELYGHSNKIECILFLKNEKAIYNVYTSDYASANKLGVTEGEGADKEKSEKDELAKINEKILKKQELLKAKDKVNKEYLISASRDKTIKLWDAIGGVCIFTFTGHDNWVRSLCEHPNGKYIVSCSDDKSIRLWDLKTGLSQKKLLNAHEKFVVAISMSPKCKMLASGSNDFTIKIWDCS
jgi:platelet-activating factor acetylhydrolase IB subunit alpha